jgi:hypothetical protein
MSKRFSRKRVYYPYAGLAILQVVLLTLHFPVTHVLNFPVLNSEIAG